MTPILRTLRGSAVAAATVLLAACSLLGPSKREPVAPPPPPPVPGDAAPVATHRFEIDPEHDDIVGVLQLTTTSKEDTFSDIARRFDLGYEEMVRANPGIDPWVPGEGRVVVVPTQFILPNAPREGIVINVPAMRLFYFPPRKPGEKQVVYTHPIGIGRVGWKTPEGVTRVIRKQKDPVWRVPPSIHKEHAENGEILPPVVQAGPDNPLGRSAMYLAWPSYLIHGTNKPYGVGLRSSHGCIRLYNEDVDPLFERVPVGTHVRVVNQPFVFGWRDGELYLQANDVLEDDPRDWNRAQKKLLSRDLATRIQKQLVAHKAEVDWNSVAGITHQPRGIPVPISGPAISLDRVLASAVKVENRIPEGANWDGKVELAVDEKKFQEMLSDSDPGTAPAASPTAEAPTKKPKS